jgi:hypothetical protein
VERRVVTVTEIFVFKRFHPVLFGLFEFDPEMTLSVIDPMNLRYRDVIAAKKGTCKDGNGQGMGRVDQYHTHTRIVDGYKILPIPVPMGIKLYPCPYLAGTHTRWVPNG